MATHTGSWLLPIWSRNSLLAPPSSQRRGGATGLPVATPPKNSTTTGNDSGRKGPRGQLLQGSTRQMHTRNTRAYLPRRLIPGPDHRLWGHTPWGQGSALCIFNKLSLGSWDTAGARNFVQPFHFTNEEMLLLEGLGLIHFHSSFPVVK